MPPVMKQLKREAAAISLKLYPNVLRMVLLPSVGCGQRGRLSDDWLGNPEKSLRENSVDCELGKLLGSRGRSCWF
jgi:hypothetical protein